MISRENLIDEGQRESNLHDLLTLLELDTKPYVVMQSSLTGGSYLPIFGAEFKVKYVSITFKRDFLHNSLLVSQGAIQLQPEDAW